MTSALQALFDLRWLGLLLAPALFAVVSAVGRSWEPLHVQRRAALLGFAVAAPVSLAWLMLSTSRLLPDYVGYGLQAHLALASIEALAVAWVVVSPLERLPYLRDPWSGARFGVYAATGVAGGASFWSLGQAPTPGAAVVATLQSIDWVLLASVPIGIAAGIAFGRWLQQGRLGRWSRPTVAAGAVGGLVVANTLAAVTTRLFGPAAFVLGWSLCAALAGAGLAVAWRTRASRRPAAPRWMQCTSCGSYSEPGLVTCHACRAGGTASPFVLRCGGCRRTVEPNDGFCGSCSARLGDVVRGRDATGPISLAAVSATAGAETDALPVDRRATDATQTR